MSHLPPLVFITFKECVFLGSFNFNLILAHVSACVRVLHGHDCEGTWRPEERMLSVFLLPCFLPGDSLVLDRKLTTLARLFDQHALVIFLSLCSSARVTIICAQLFTGVLGI